MPGCAKCFKSPVLSTYRQDENQIHKINKIHIGTEIDNFLEVVRRFRFYGHKRSELFCQENVIDGQAKETLYVARKFCESTDDISHKSEEIINLRPDQLWKAIAYSSSGARSRI